MTNVPFTAERASHRLGRIPEEPFGAESPAPEPRDVAELVLSDGWR